MMDLDRVNNYLARVEESEKTTFKPVGSRLKVGVDLGTAYIVLVVLDEENNPVACEKQAAQVLRDGVVVDYTGALRIVRSLKEKLEARLGTELVNCAIAMPAGTESSVKTVVITTDEPDSQMLCNNSTMDLPVSTSRFPVGSSARIIAGELSTARAITMRCCSPPESSLGSL